MDIQLESRNVVMTPRWKAEIERRMADLRMGHGDLTHGRVTLVKNRHHKKDSRVAEAVVVITLPGRTAIARKEDKTFEEAIRGAFAAIESDLRSYREKRATTEPRTAPLAPLRGVIGTLFPPTGLRVHSEGGRRRSLLS